MDSNNSNSNNNSNNNSNSINSNNISFNNSNNNNSNEILFWKVFNNIVIRNHILSQLNSSNNNNSNNNNGNNSSRQYRSYNGTTSLELMVEHNKIDMILDKLKSNHFIHFDRIPNIYSALSRDPYFKAKVDEIYKLLWFNYSGHIKRIYCTSELFEIPIAIYKLWYMNSDDGGNSNSGSDSGINSGKYNNYSVYQVYNEYLRYGKSDHRNIIKIYNSNNNQINQNMDQQEFKRQLASTPSTLYESIQEEIQNAIYNDKEIPVNAIQFCLDNGAHGVHNIVELDLVQNGVLVLPLYIKSVLLNSTNVTVNNINRNSKEILESIYLALLYKSSLVVKLSGSCVNSADNVLLAKINVLNKLNQEFNSSKSIGTRKLILDSDSSSKFKKYLIENKVDTIDELIWIARDTIIDDDKRYKSLQYFGDHYQYLQLVSKYSNIQLQNKNPPQSQERISLSLVLCYSVINQSIKAFKNEFNQQMFNEEKDYEDWFKCQIKQINSVGSGYGKVSNGNSNDQSIRDKSTQYFNQLLKLIGSYDSADQLAIWMSIFKIVIYNYNSKLFDWLLDSIQALRDIYYQLLCDDYFKDKLYSAHSRFNQDTNQINYEMLDIYLKHMGRDNGFKFKFTANYLVKRDKSYFNQQNQLILNHIIKSTSTTTTNNINKKYKRSINQFEINDNSNILNSSKRLWIKTLILMGFNNGSIDQATEIYNQIDQQSLFNFFNNIQDDDDNDDIGLENEILENLFKSKVYNNKSSILVVHLIKSIIDLDFESINKIISTTLNSNNNKNSTNTSITINIPTTINNSIDIIKYLITNNYLKQFNLHYIITLFISKVNVDKQIILDIIKSQSINCNNSNNSGSDSLESLIDKLYIELELNNKKITFQNSEYSLQALENTDERDINSKIYDYLDYGHFNTVVQFILQTNYNMEKFINYLKYSIVNNSISVECFSKLYPVIISSSTISSQDINRLCRFNLDIFEFIWANHFKDDKERKDYLMDCFVYCELFHINSSYNQLAEHILQSKREFISESLKLNQSQLFKLHKDALVYGNTSIFNQVRSIYPSFKFDIDFIIIQRLITESRYDAIEYLHENNLIPNLHQIIGDDNLNRLAIKGSSGTNVSLSMFILIHSIIKLQQQQ